jgi:hypothetical protein
MGAQCLPFLLLLLNVSPQVDRGIDYEHKGYRIEMLMVTFSTSNPRLLSIACDYPTPIVYHRYLTDQEAHANETHATETLSVYKHSRVQRITRLRRNKCF